MRIFIISLLFLMGCLCTGVCFADEKADCINICANDKRASDMYCPPAGGFTDEDNKQCMTKNSADFTSCKNTCSPPAAPAEEQQSAPTETPAETTAEAVPPAQEY